MSDRRSLSGLTVCVTGAASGIGRATALMFGRAGITVLVTDLVHSGAQDAAASITSAGGSATAYKLDVAEPREVSDFASAVTAEHSIVDVLVNNAGVAGLAAIDVAAYQQVWTSALEVMLTGPQLMISALPFVAGVEVTADHQHRVDRSARGYGD